jgi:NAD(P)-dependent dehydrogenase (short-subunit alcohol dehydrogenase family)
MMALNLRGTFACSTEAARIMRARGTKGRITVIGSIVQQLALAGQVAYGTTKAASHSSPAAWLTNSPATASR